MDYQEGALPAKVDVEGGINASPPPPMYGASEPPPPPYDQTPRDAPPSYQSLYGQMQDAKASSSGPLDFLKKLVKILLNTIAVTVFMLILLAVPISMVVIGAIYKDDCRVEPMIPIYLIVSGCCYIVKNILDLIQRGRSDNNDDDRHENTPSNTCSRLLGCFLFAFFIAGNVWIYRNFPPSDTVGDPDYCNPILYYFAFWITTLVYIFCLLTCCCICCAAVVTAFTSDG